MADLMSFDGPVSADESNVTTVHVRGIVQNVSADVKVGLGDGFVGFPTPEIN